MVAYYRKVPLAGPADGAEKLTNVLFIEKAGKRQRKDVFGKRLFLCFKYCLDLGGCRGRGIRSFNVIEPSQVMFSPFVLNPPDLLLQKYNACMYNKTVIPELRKRSGMVRARWRRGYPAELSSEQHSAPE